MALASAARCAGAPASAETKPFEPNMEPTKRRLLRKGVTPTPKILHVLRKKEMQKSLRKSKKQPLLDPSPPLPEAQRQALEHEAHFRAAAAEYRGLMDTLSLAGKPWERSNGFNLSGLRSAGEGRLGGRLKREHLEELKGFLEERNGEKYKWLLVNDVEEIGGVVVGGGRKGVASKQQRVVGDDEKIRLLVHRLSSTNLDMQDWRFPRLMKQSGIYFTEMHLLKILEGLRVLGSWKHALSVVEWVYNEEQYKHTKSRFVYTKLLAVLGKSRRPNEALRIFSLMREDAQIYPDMAAYHTIAVTLGQAGLVEELINIIEYMRQSPSPKIKNLKRRNWDPCLEPDVVIFNAVLNACVPSRQWKGVSWVFQQMRASGLKPTGATYGLGMEVMLEAGKYDLVHRIFEKMQRAGQAPQALTYKVLLRAFWKEGKVDEAVKAVRNMEQRGVVGTASVYYELACCLCNNGMWQDAMVEVDKLRRLPLTKPLAVTFTGMILSSMDGGYIHECISIFERMKDYCSPNIGTINAMLKVYSCIDIFAKAKQLFESTVDAHSGYGTDIDDDAPLKPDAYTYNYMLCICASSHQWEYFEYVYKEMALRGFQLDQKKYACLLVEASRAGKTHLLEHAFDTVLEEGGIPHVSLFMEMICQTISQQNFERSVCLIKGMALASLQVSENKWKNLFHRNKDRLSKDKLQNLLEYLDSSDFMTEDPVPNLLKSLQSLCGPRLLKSSNVLAVPNDASTDKSTVYENDRNAESCAKDAYGHLDGSVDDVACISEIENDCTIPDSSLYGKSETSSTEKALNLLATHIRNPCSDLPSASEILESWTKDRVKDGFFPFQY